MNKQDIINVYFTDFFEVSSEQLEAFGAFDVSLTNDLPLFIDPFLLFNSKKFEYQQLHNEMIRYLRFLRDKSMGGEVDEGRLRSWFTFHEIKQTWLGFSVSGNKGSGLGMDFARSLNSNLNKVFVDFGKEQVTKSSHLEKLCLIKTCVGRDNISDFTTNLIKEYLLNFSQRFAREYIPEKFIKKVAVEKVRFNYETETWEMDWFELPYAKGDYVILTPMDMLTKDDIWINKEDMLRDYKNIRYSVPDDQLRAQLDNYLMKVLPFPRKAKQNEIDSAIMSAYLEFPELIDYYIRYKEENGDQAEYLSKNRVDQSKKFYVYLINRLVEDLNLHTNFYKIAGDTYTEARERVMFLKDVIENKGGWKVFYPNGKEPIRKEQDAHILFRLTWFSSSSDVTREANDGRGPVDFKISRGSKDKSLVEFKLASNPQLERNLKNQVDIYKAASDAKNAIKVIFYFSRQELNKINRILKKLNQTGHPDIILIDARSDNKPSASKV